MLMLFLVISLAFLIGWSLATYIGLYCFVHSKGRDSSKLSRFLWFAGSCIAGYSAGKSLVLVIMVLSIML